MEITAFDYVLPEEFNPADVLDLRGLEAPEPMVRILQSSTQLGPGDHFLAHLPHVPHPLFPHLETRQLTWQIHEQPDGSAVLMIRINT